MAREVGTLSISLFKKSLQITVSERWSEMLKGNSLDRYEFFEFRIWADHWSKEYDFIGVEIVVLGVRLSLELPLERKTNREENYKRLPEIVKETQKRFEQWAEWGKIEQGLFNSEEVAHA